MERNAHLIKLGAESIHRLDTGRFGAAIDRALRIIERDIIDRPANAAGKAETRELCITLRLTPRVKFDAELCEVRLLGIDVEPRVRGSVPPVVGNIHDVRIHNGSSHCNIDAPDSFEQLPLFDMEDSDE